MFRRRSSTAVCDSNVNQSVALYFALNASSGMIKPPSGETKLGEEQAFVCVELIPGVVLKVHPASKTSPESSVVASRQVSVVLASVVSAALP